MNTKSQQKMQPSPFLIEVAWEVCNPIGGIHTVIRSKVKSMVDKWKSNYLLIGPYFSERSDIYFEPITDVEEEEDPIYKAVLDLRARGYDLHYGYWLVPEKPRVVLLNPYSAWPSLAEIKSDLWRYHNIGTDTADNTVNEALAFGNFLRNFIGSLMASANYPRRLILHFHEWLAATCICDLRRDKVPVAIVFTTHATMLARYLAANDPNFYERLATYNWQYEAKKYLIEPQVLIERAAAHGAHVFTTVSNVTMKECEFLLGRKPDLVLPNGLNIEKFDALHEFQVLHQRFKLQIHEFIASHFFQSYTFDLDNTLYFFTSGRYEYRNKGFDMMLEGLRRLNEKMKAENIDRTVVMFFITQKPSKGIIGSVLQKRALMSEIKKTCTEIERKIGNNLFQSVVTAPNQRLPDLNQFVDEHLQLRLRRIIHAWKTRELPPIVSHDIHHNGSDEILNYLRHHQLVNRAEDKVKVVYHPDFISPSSPLLPMEYMQFVRGCHLGLFISFYEPWGYTPLECVASGVPTVTTDLSGFGDFVIGNDKRHIYVLNRSTQSFHNAAEDLANYMLSFVRLTRRERISHRNKVENTSMMFDWSRLRKHYDAAEFRALQCLED